MTEHPAIDPELRDYLNEGKHTMSDEALEASLVASGGPRDAIKVWEGKNLVIDGHRRLAVCQRLGLPYRVEQVPGLVTYEDVYAWMDAEQDLRRNREPVANAKALVRKVAAIKTNKAKAVKQVAEETGVSKRTVYRAGELVRSMGKLRPEAKTAIESGKVDYSQADIHRLANMSPAKQVAAVEKAETEQKPIGAVLRETTFDRQEKFRLCFKHLGGLAKVLDDLKRDDKERYSEARKHITDLTVLLEGWKVSG